MGWEDKKEELKVLSYWNLNQFHILKHSRIKLS